MDAPFKRMIEIVGQPIPATLKESVRERICTNCKYYFLIPEGDGLEEDHICREASKAEGMSNTESCELGIDKLTGETWLDQPVTNGFDDGGWGLSIGGDQYAAARYDCDQRLAA